MIFDGCHFEYGSFNSREYDLVFAHLDTSIDTRATGEVETQYLFNKRNLRRYITGYNYANSPVNIEVEIMTSRLRPLGLSERRRIEKSLFRSRGFQKLYIDIADDYFCETYKVIDKACVRMYLNCRFVNPEKIEDGSGMVIGYKCTMECDSLMFTQDATTQEYAILNGGRGASSAISVDVDTDLEEYIYPVVSIKVGATGGDITICNNSDDSTRLTKFIGLSSYATIQMRGDINYVNEQYYDCFSGRNFIRLLDGTNTFTVTGDVEKITFEYSVRRFL